MRVIMAGSQLARQRCPRHCQQMLLRRTCAACGALSLAVDASKYVQKYFKFDATFDRKPVQLFENWCDVVTAWCEGNYPGSDVLYSLELF